MKLYIYVIKFLFIGALFIVSNENLHLINIDERNLFYDQFYNWITGLVSHVSQITGYVVNSGWLPGEDQNSSFVFGNQD